MIGLAAIAAASPIASPQQIDITGILAAGPPPSATVATVPTIITINPVILASAAAAEVTAAAQATNAALEKRATDASSGCATRQIQPTGAGPVPSPDTASAFLAYSYFSSVASAAPTPSGYVSAFTNLQAENSAYGYLGYTVLSSYDTQSCANQCNAIYGCQSINIRKS